MENEFKFTKEEQQELSEIKRRTLKFFTNLAINNTENDDILQFTYLQVSFLNNYIADLIMDQQELIERTSRSVNSQNGN